MICVENRNHKLVLFATTIWFKKIKILVVIDFHYSLGTDSFGASVTMHELGNPKVYHVEILIITILVSHSILALLILYNWTSHHFRF